jgi:hypothetical protein
MTHIRRTLQPERFTVNVKKPSTTRITPNDFDSHTTIPKMNFRRKIVAIYQPLFGKSIRNRFEGRNHPDYAIQIAF